MERITFTGGQRNWIRQLAQERTRNWDGGGYRYGIIHQLRRDLIGVAGEAALAIYLGIPMKWQVGQDPGYDHAVNGVRINVRARGRHSGQPCDLLIDSLSRLQKCDAFVLAAIPSKGSDPPNECLLLGWENCTALRSLVRRKVVTKKDLGYGRHWLFKRELLQPMMRLRDHVSRETGGDDE